MKKRSYDTPEGFLTFPADAEPGYYIDAINATIARAKAVLVLLSGQFDGTNSGERFADGVIADALWDVMGQLGLLEILVEHGWETEFHGGARPGQPANFAAARLQERSKGDGV